MCCRCAARCPIGSIGGGASGLITNNVGVRFDYRYLRSLHHR